ncbi:MAG: ABC transporter permease [Tannerellaceae bacterium]|nr:ABC transporter permease [Tannerellaceae bacterium]
MFRTFRNLLHVLKQFKLATLTNLIGLTLAFLAFMVIKIHVNYEYGFDSSIPNRERIFQMENLRDDGVWESNFARPQLERFIASSPFIEAAAITKNDSYSSSRVGISANPGQEGTTYMEKVEWIRPGFTDVFHFRILAGSEESINEPGKVLISEKQAKKIFGETNPVGKEIFLPELNGIGASSRYADIPSLTVGGVYRDFPENTRLQNVLYLSIPDSERIDDWITGSYYGYVLLSSPEVASAIAEQYMSENAAFLKQFSIYDIRLRPVPELYFSHQARADAGPTGSRLRTNMLFFISVLVILIALINYINLSVALAPVRIKSINTQKVLGCSQSLLQKTSSSNRWECPCLPISWLCCYSSYPEITRW